MCLILHKWDQAVLTVNQVVSGIEYEFNLKFPDKQGKKGIQSFGSSGERNFVLTYLYVIMLCIQQTFLKTRLCQVLIC